MDAMTILRAIAAIVMARLAIVVIREDLAERKIRNRHLAAGLGACAAVYLLQAALTASGSLGWASGWLAWSFYGLCLRHLALSLAAAVALWLLDVWPAGDAKLFMVCAAFLPLIRPGLRTFPNYLFLHMLANIFVLSTFFLAARSLAEFLRGFLKDPAGLAARAAASGCSKAVSTVRGARRWREWLPAAATTAALFLLQNILRLVVMRRAGALVAQPALLGLVLMLAWEKAAWLSDPRFGSVAAALGAAALCVVAWKDPAAALGLLRATSFQLTGFGLLFWAVRGALNRHLTTRSTESVGLADLRPGMILSDQAAGMMRRDRVFFRERMEPLRRDGLTPDQVLRVREWFLGLPNGVRAVEVTRGDAFAPWIFAGALFTLAVSRDAASLLVHVLR